jgi:hypothetical protein
MRSEKTNKAMELALVAKLHRELTWLRRCATQARKAAESAIDKMKDVERDLGDILHTVDRIEGDQGASTTRRSVGATRGHRRRRPRVTP